jgi:hypothetical protein
LGAYTGSTNFFAKLASVDPLAQALNLPGAHKYAQSQAQDRAGQTDTNGGAYTGVNATLAGANAGYAPGGPGATPGFTPTTPTAGGGLFGKLQGAANLSGNLTPQPWANGSFNPTAQAHPLAGTQNSFVQPSQTVNPYVAAARGAASQQNQQWGP